MILDAITVSIGVDAFHPVGVDLVVRGVLPGSCECTPNTSNSAPRALAGASPDLIESTINVS